jgi:excinuclease ABC subunit B
MPEVSLVAILDADKEGFLRSETTLVQTIGRAARNINGKAILYADVMTGSIQRALAETDRRRARQIEYNRLHNITPRGIQKAVADVMEGAYTDKKRALKHARNAEQKNPWTGMDVAAITKKINELEKLMYKHARDLEFEKAADIRDEISSLREAGLEIVKN